MASNEQKVQIPTIQGFFGGASEALETVYRFGAKAQERQDALDQELRQINGVTFFWNRSTCRWQPLEVPLIVPDDEPVPAPIKFFTLDGLIDYIRENVEGTIPGKDSGDRLILQVVNETTVKLRGKPTTNHKERNIVAYGAMVTAFMDAINKAQTINPWHRVEEQPKIGVPVLVTYIGGNTGKVRCDLLAAYDGITWRYWEDEMLDEVTVVITHWMPIELPKE